MKFRRSLAVILSLLALLCLNACGQAPEPTTAPVETTVAETTLPPSALEQYAAACEAVVSAPSLSLRITSEKTISVAGETITESSDQVVTQARRGTDSEKILVSELVDYGENYSVIYEEIYSGGTLYLLVDGTHRLAGTMDAETYFASHIPAVLLDAALYETVEAEDGKLSFRDPTAAESWAMPEGAALVDASGTAYLDDSGALDKSEYTLSYDYGSTRVTESVSVSVKLEAGEIHVPAVEDYIKLTDISAVRLSDRVCGYALQSSAISSTLTESITCQAAGVVRSQSTAIDLLDREDLTASITTNLTQLNYSNGRSESYTQEESFRDGVYSIREDGGEAETDRSVDSAVIRTYCDDSFLSNMLVLDYWRDAEVRDLGDVYLVNCTYSKLLAEDLRAEICQTLFEDDLFLDKLTSDTELTQISGYFAFDKYTGLPTAAGCAYAGSDVIDGQSYVLALQRDQTFHTPNLSITRTLSGEPLPDLEPENKATPLLYHVTKQGGQQMWLMGTIHVGDSRTAYLPQEVYDAFNASNILAVECDIQAFEEKAATDPEVQAMIASSYYYTDGTTAANHVDPALLEQATPYMKATGTWNSTLTVTKPSLWANYLENFYLRQGCDLLSEKGMDNRLLTMAKEQKKSIREIETVQSQLDLLTGYSDELQAILLKEAISYEPGEYYAGVQELYELWCQGDEEALRAALSDESGLEDLTEEERRLYDEYQKAMITDRNEYMLSVATEYLRSGNVVFYAVGMAHLIQDNGLVNALRDAGYTVEAVIYE